MKYLVRFVLICSLHASAVHAQLPVAWTKVLGGPAADAATGVCQLPDGGYILSGGISPGWSGLVRLDSRGDTLWTRLMPLSGWGGTKDVKLTPDGGFVVTGRASPSHLTIIKTDSLGNVEWQYISPDTGTVQTNGEAVCVTAEGGYAATGSIFFPGVQPYEDMYVVKLGPDGQEWWHRNYGFPTSSDWGGYDIMAAPGSGVLAVGSVDNPAWHPRAFAIKLNNAGGAAWQNAYGDESGYHEIYGCALAANGDYLLAGLEYFYTSAHAYDYWVARVTSSGGMIWQQTFGYGNYSYEIAQALCELPNGQILVAGGKNTGQFDYVGEGWILGLNSAGQQEWEWEMDSPGSDAFHDITATADGGALACGVTSGFGDSDGDILLVKFCSPTAHAGTVRLIAQSPTSAGYRLEHVHGEIDTVIFTGVPPGTTGWVTGEAATYWNMMTNGDGNDGDSIIFRTPWALFTDTIDTFWVSRPEPRCSIVWRAECRTDTLHSLNAALNIAEFSGGHIDLYVVLDLFTTAEAGLDRFEVWGRQSNTAFALLGSRNAANDSNGHHYVFDYLPVRYQYILHAYDAAGCETVFPGLAVTRGVNLPAAELPQPLPDAIELEAYPNPFNATTELRLRLPSRVRLTYAVHDVLGRHLATLHDGPLEPGKHKFTFDGSNLPSGIYFARVQAGEFVKTQKLLLLK